MVRDSCSSLGTTFHEIYHFLPFSKRVRAVAVANKFPEEKTIWERKNKKFELCLHSSLKINCLIFFWKESEVWQSAMSLVKSWKLRKVSQKVRQRKARSTFTGGFNRHLLISKKFNWGANIKKNIIGRLALKHDDFMVGQLVIVHQWPVLNH